MTIKSGISVLKRRLINLTRSPEKTYLLIGLMGVLGFAFITPPFQGPDEEAHYVRAQYIAHGHIVPVDVNKSDASLPESISDTLQTTFYDDDLRGRTNFNYEFSRTKAALAIPLDRQATYKPQMISYSPLPYLPAVPGIFLANAMNASPLISMYVSRVLLGFASISLVFLAIRLLPYKKYLLVVVGLVPMMLFQQSVVSVDGTSYALLAVFIAYLLYLRERTHVTSKQWVLLGIICVGITLAKPLVFVFLPLILFLIGKKHSFRWFTAIAATCLVALVAWTLAISTKTDVINVSGTPANVDSDSQIETITREPKRFPRVLWNSYMTFYGDDEARGVIGVFGAADTIYPLWMTMAYVALIAIVAVLRLSGEKVLRLRYGWKLLALTLAAVYFIGVNVALYLSFTPVNFDIVYGVQGRYFLPILIVTLMVVATGGFVLNKRDTHKMVAWIFVSSLTLVILALFITYQRYFLYTP